MLHSYMPRATYHFSQRHIFETYKARADDGEPLLRYKAPSTKGTLYLRDVPELGSAREFLERFGDEARFFAVIPREKLAQVNYDARRTHERNVHVLDARSSKLVLLSNKLEAGEEDHNFVAENILELDDGEMPDEMQHDVTFPDAQGNPVHLTLDGQIEFLGYSLDREARGDALPSYGRGDEIELTMYFRSLKRVPGNQKLFVHIDTRGNRLHGDHYPAGGDLPTNYWLPGDVIRDTHRIPVGDYARRGVYTINFGFYIGSRRMKVSPAKAHGGRNRVTIGRLRVK